MKVVQADQDFNFRSSMSRRNLFHKKEFTFAYFNLGEGQLSVGGIVLSNGKETKLYYAVALCSPEDKFVKETGRVKIEQHLILTKYSHKRGVLDVSESNIETKSAFRVLKYAADYYLWREDTRLPQWAKGYELTFRNSYKEQKEENNKYYASYLVA